MAAAMLRSVSNIRGHGDDPGFTARVQRFEATAEALRALQAALSASAAAVEAQRSAAADLAERLRNLDGGRATRPGNDPFAGLGEAIAGANAAAAVGARRLHEEVQLAVAELVAELPKVKDAIKRRNAEAGSAGRWERKAAAARAVNGPNASAKTLKKVNECERRLREAVQRFDMSHVEAVNRMDHIHRNLPAMLCTPLGRLVEITAETLAGQQRSYFNAAQVHVKNVADRLAEMPLVIPMEHIQGPPSHQGGSGDGSSAGPGIITGVVSPVTEPSTSVVEVWDDADFGDIDPGAGSPDAEPCRQSAQGETAVSNFGVGAEGEANSVSSSGSSEIQAFGGVRGFHSQLSASSLSPGPQAASVPRRCRSGMRMEAHLEGNTQRASAPPGASDGGLSSCESSSGASHSQASPVLSRLRALYAFRALEKNELSFSEGDVLEVLSTDDSGWWEGRICGGGEGFFPVAYCVEMTDEEEVEYIKQQSKQRRRRERTGLHRKENLALSHADGVTSNPRKSEKVGEPTKTAVSGGGDGADGDFNAKPVFPNPMSSSEHMIEQLKSASISAEGQQSSPTG